MNVVKCKNGHFFDGDSFEQCPHCGAMIGAGGNHQPSSERQSKSSFSIFGKKQKKTPERESAGECLNEYKGWGAQEKITDNESLVTPTVPLAGIYNMESEQEEEAFFPEKEQKNIENRELFENKKEEVFKQEMVENEHHHNESLQAAIKKASANPEGKTIGVFSMGKAAESRAAENKTSSFAPLADPVVGWLVCIKGNHFGESFNIAAARNSIGRSETNHIVLMKDNSVSREKHAWIVYEPKKEISTYSRERAAD